MTDGLLELAERCEAVTVESDSNAGPVRALEIEIHDTVFGRDTYNCGGDGQRGIPKYARSLDAAMTLVPEGAFWSITMRGVRRGGFHAACATEEGNALDWREAATPALALCAAALRARNTPPINDEEQT